MRILYKVMFVDIFYQFIEFYMIYTMVYQISLIEDYMYTRISGLRTQNSSHRAHSRARFACFQCPDSKSLNYFFHCYISDCHVCSPQKLHPCSIAGGTIAHMHSHTCTHTLNTMNQWSFKPLHNLIQ